MSTKWTLIAGLLLLNGCAGPKPSTAPLEMTATIKDIMNSMIDPSGDFMFEAVAEVSDANGITQKAPKTEDEWKEVRNRAFVLYEGMNLMMMEGRKVARPDDKSQFPEVELEPGEIQKLIDENRPRFVKRAKRLQEAAAMALQAVDLKDTKALFESIERIDRACENCHLVYWYPKDSRAIAEARKAGTFEED